MNTATDALIVKAPKSSGGWMGGQGSSSSDFVGFYGTTPIVQPSGAAQAAVSATAATTTTPWGFSTSTQADAIVTLVNKIRTDLVALGLLKGSA